MLSGCVFVIVWCWLFVGNGCRSVFGGVGRVMVVVVVGHSRLLLIGIG